MSNPEFDELVKVFYRARKNKRSSKLRDKKTELEKEYGEACLNILFYVGIPSRYIDRASDGTPRLDNIAIGKARYGDEFSIFYNYIGKNPKGKGHAHAVIDKNGEISYDRKIGEPHGVQNFVRNQSGPRLVMITRH